MHAPLTYRVPALALRHRAVASAPAPIYKTADFVLATDRRAWILIRVMEVDMSPIPYRTRSSTKRARSPSPSVCYDRPSVRSPSPSPPSAPSAPSAPSPSSSPSSSSASTPSDDAFTDESLRVRRCVGAPVVVGVDDEGGGRSSLLLPLTLALPALLLLLVVVALVPLGGA